MFPFEGSGLLKTANYTQIKILRASPELKSEEIAFHELIFVKCHVSNKGLLITAEEYSNSW